MGVKVRNTTVNGGLSGRDKGINKTFAYRNGKSYSSMKQYTAPTNPQTAFQNAVRVVFALFSSGWSSLSEAGRNAWDAAAKNITGENQFGTTQVTGKMFYVGANIALTSADRETTEVPLQMANEAKVDTATLQYDAPDMNFSGVFDSTSEKNTLQLRCSSPVSAGSSKGKKKIILWNVICDSNFSTDVSFNYQSRFGSIPIGSKVFWDIRQISEGGGIVTVAKGYFIGE